MYLTKEIKEALRKKRATLNLSKSDTAELLGINRLTYGQLENPDYNHRVQQSTYQKITQWLAKDY
ncbi:MULTISPECIES: transcriptional regulator [unclassified Lactococcus]|uniref:transcriptional regulator n=1 Tax=unclassified Lactococcus TaxID=2643510 RepID=UPI0011C7F87D|nr:MULTISPECIES: transcriptional regulator [unclassified Lactococcus]MQW23272.1 transcriptional regulator [Lactococcus sp. dk101]TXK38061.1 transcriptional regulator [Lactococcus sp. dk310]TXK49740.1 transcriptional regulator [Lactococcus sp. dk322]